MALQRCFEVRPGNALLIVVLLTLSLGGQCEVTRMSKGGDDDRDIDDPMMREAQGLPPRYKMKMNVKINPCSECKTNDGKLDCIWSTYNKACVDSGYQHYCVNERGEDNVTSCGEGGDKCKDSLYHAQNTEGHWCETQCPHNYKGFGTSQVGRICKLCKVKRCINCGEDLITCEECDKGYILLNKNTQCVKDLITTIGDDLACQSCRESIDHFRFEVARQIKGKMDRKKKKVLFDDRFGRVCADKRFPKKMAIAEINNKTKKKRYLSSDEAFAYGGDGLSLRPENRANAIAACNLFVGGYRKVLWKAIENMKAEKATDINFHRLVCLQKNVCNKTDIPDGGEEEEMAQYRARLQQDEEKDPKHTEL